ncbi:quinolinate synthase NadA, partial [Ideonella sp.]|uniref:quinolinate synthase NadA n=1 Tax=Ideonella sp. TaxID=1929293 RepID=UPI003BB5816D
ATCKSCAHCPWMAMNGLQGVIDCLEQGQGEVFVPADTAREAVRCIDRMLAYVAANPSALAPRVQGMVRGIGAA